MKKLLVVTGVFTGGIIGYMYWKYAGCVTGTCPITSNKYISITYGGVLGALLFSIIKDLLFRNKSIND